jgi:predicted nuclease with TOPRIM domain
MKHSLILTQKKCRKTNKEINKMDILKTVQNEEGKIDENKLTTVLEEYKDLGTKNKELSEKVSGCYHQNFQLVFCYLQA